MGYYAPVLADTHSFITRLGRLGRAALVAVLCVSLAPSVAFAAKKKIALVPAEDGGAAEKPLQAKITKVLKKQKIQVVAAAAVTKATKKDGLPSEDQDWTKLARKLKVDGFVEMTFSQTGTKRRVEIRVRNGEDGAVSTRESFAAKGAPKKLVAVAGAGFWKKLGPAVKATAAPKKDAGGGLAARDLLPGDEPSSGAKPEGEEAKPAGEPEKVAVADEEEKPKKKEPEEKAEPAADEEGAEKKKDEEDEDAEAKPVRRRRGEGADKGKTDDDEPRAFEVEVGAKFMRRVFQYVPTAGTPKFYLLNFTPLVNVRLAYFPITYVGVFASAEYNGALKTNIYPTATREFVIGGAARLPFSIGQVGASAAFFQHLFVLVDTASQTDAPRSSILNTPNTTYMGARFALNGRIRLGDYVLLGAEGAYRLVTNPGSPAEGTDQVRSANFFPNGVVTGAFDGSAFVGIGIMKWLEIRAGADYRRYVLGSLRGSPTPGLAAVQSATDDYLGFTIGAVGVLGGK